MQTIFQSKKVQKDDEIKEKECEIVEHADASVSRFNYCG